MSIGYIEMNPKYINVEHHPDGKWPDEPENTRLVFQFDPASVKVVVRTKWKAGDKKQGANGDLNIPWDYSGEVPPNELDMDLIFSEYIEESNEYPIGSLSSDEGSQRPLSVQRSLEILEAMANPIAAPVVQLIQTDIQNVMVIDKTRDKAGPEDTNSSNAWEAWRLLRTHRAIIHEGVFTRTALLHSQVRVTEKVSVNGSTIVDGVWHPPRPLHLYLCRDEPVQCIIEKLEIDIMAMDEGTGIPTLAKAHITVQEWLGYNLENGLVRTADPKLGEKLTVKEWNQQILSGQSKRAIPDKVELVKAFEFSETPFKEKPK